MGYLRSRVFSKEPVSKIGQLKLQPGFQTTEQWLEVQAAQCPKGGRLTLQLDYPLDRPDSPRSTSSPNVSIRTLRASDNQWFLKRLPAIYQPSGRLMG